LTIVVKLVYYRHLSGCFSIAVPVAPAAATSAHHGGKRANGLAGDASLT
jgi:hypothetical protein